MKNFIPMKNLPSPIVDEKNRKKCFVSPIKHAFAECNGRSKEYMKFRGKIGGRKNESEETQMSNRRLWHYRSAFNCMYND